MCWYLILYFSVSPLYLFFISSFPPFFFHPSFLLPFFHSVPYLSAACPSPVLVFRDSCLVSRPCLFLPVSSRSNKILLPLFSSQKIKILINDEYKKSRNTPDVCEAFSEASSPFCITSCITCSNRSIGLAEGEIVRAKSRNKSSVLWERPNIRSSRKTTVTLATRLHMTATA